MTDQTHITTENARGARPAESSRRVLGYSTLAAIALMAIAVIVFTAS